METVPSPLSRLKEKEFFPESWKTLLKGVVAYVDVRTGSDNRSKSIANEMERMGAVILAHFSKKVTHVIFKDGSKPVYDKAKSLGIPILSYLWVVQCKEHGSMVPTKEFPTINTQDYDSPFFKWRKVKSMQPKELEEEMKIVEKRLERRRKKVQQSLFLSDNKVEKQPLPYTPITERKSIIDTLIESSPLVQERIHKELASGKSYEDVFTINEGEEDDFDTYFDTPLMIKFIAKNYYSPCDPPPPSVRRILSDIKRQATPTTSQTVTLCPAESRLQTDEASSLPPPTDPSPVSLNFSSDGIKRKKCRSSLSSIAKKRKENVEEVPGIAPRRKLLFQSKLLSVFPEDPMVALTPETSPQNLKRNHPCFSQLSLEHVKIKSPRQETENACMEQMSADAHTNNDMEISPSPSPKKSSTFTSPSPNKIFSKHSLRRESLADFRFTSPKKKTDSKIKLPSMVCTSLHSESIEVVAKAVQRLGGFKMVEAVNDSTTHVICGDTRRTMNVMRGVVRGAKLVKLEWIVDSMTRGHWLDEDDYGLERFSAPSARYRGKLGEQRLFRDYPSIYVSSRSVVPQRDLMDVIKCVGGYITNSSQRASIIVGQFKQHVNVPCINGKWILDCIEAGVTLPLTAYILNAE